MPRPSNSAERRLQIARALRKVMAAKGYDGATIADVASEAGLAPGLVHYHFHNKLEILVAVTQDLFAHHLATLTDKLALADGDAAKQLATFVDLHLATGRDADAEALACWITIIGEALREPLVRASYEQATAELTGVLTGIVRRGVEAKLFRCADAQAASAALMASILGYFVLAATARAQIPRASASPSVKAMARGLLRIDGPLPRRPARKTGVA